MNSPADFPSDPTCVRRGTRLWKSPPTPPCTGGLGGAASPETTALLIPIEQIIVGDLVFAHDGKPHQVLQIVTKEYRGELIGIKHNACQAALWLTTNHRLLCKPRPRSLGGKNDWSGIPTSQRSLPKKLRTQSSPPELLLWSVLKNEQLGVKFRRQHPIGPYVADFYSRAAHLVVEVDGSDHFQADARAHDQERDAFMRGLGLDILRFTSTEVNQNLPGVCLTIQNQISLRRDSPAGALWIQASQLLAGDIVFFGLQQYGVEVTSVERAAAAEIVYALEIAEAHSFITEVCAVHNCAINNSPFGL